MHLFKKLLLTQEQITINNLVEIGVSEKLIKEHELQLLEVQIPFLSINRNHPRLAELIEAIPTHPYEKFKVVYNLVKYMLQSGQLSEFEVNVIRKILSYLIIPMEKLITLIEYVRIHVMNGNSQKEAYQKLSYLLA